MRLSANFTTYFFWSVRTHFPQGTYFFGNVQTMQDLMYICFYSFCRNCILRQHFKVLFVYIFYTILVKFYIYFLFMSVGWDVKWCPVSRITTPLARKRQFLWISRRAGSCESPGKHRAQNHSLPLKL